MFTLTPDAQAIDAMLDTHFGVSLNDVIDLKLGKIESGLSELAKDIIEGFFLDGIESGAASVSLLIGGAAAGGPLGLLSGIVGLALGGNAVAEFADALATIQLKMNVLEAIFEKLQTMEGYRDFAPLRGILHNELDPTQLGRQGGTELRMAMVCLEDGDVYYMTENLTLLRGHADTMSAMETWALGGTAKQKAIDGVIASSALPVFFPPVALSEDQSPNSQKKHFVDGGIRELTPYQAAIELGCDRIVSIMAPPQGTGGVV